MALIDGLVNAHTHLEFSLQTSQPPLVDDSPTGFVRWCDTGRTSRIYCKGIRTGIDESLRSGTTLIGDIATIGWAADNYQVSGCRRIVFQEVAGAFRGANDAAETTSPDPQRALHRRISQSASVLMLLTANTSNSCETRFNWHGMWLPGCDASCGNQR